jgi:hypothetical protein
MHTITTKPRVEPNVNTPRRNRRIVLVGGALAIVAIGVAGIVAITNNGNDEAVVGTDPGTAATAPSSPPPTTATTPPTTPTPTSTTPTSTTPASTTPATTSPVVVPPTSPAAVVPTVWVGQKLAGWYENATFVPQTFGAELPAGLVDAPIAATGLDGATFEATVTDENCSEPYLSPSPDVWDLRFTSGAPVVGELAEPSDHPAGLVAALEAIGVSQASSRGYAVPDGGDGTSDRLVLVDGWNANFQYPTWVATWDAETGELSKLEGDLDPSQALDIGNPIEAFYDIDGDGGWEIVYGVGDGWTIQDLDTAESIVFGDAHPCPSE